LLGIKRFVADSPDARPRFAAADGSFLAIRRRPVGLDGSEIRKAAGDVLRLVIVIPRASIAVWRALRRHAEHRRIA
jgi:hypothetical protein